MSKRSAPSGSKPELEVLEDRQAPGTLQTAPPGTGAATTAVAPPGVREVVNQAPPSVASTANVPAAEAVFSTPAALNPLLSQVGRFPEPSFQLPTSGAHTDGPPAGEPTALLQPAVDVPVPTTEESAAAADDSVWYT
jgi:hypothetical protein